MAGNSISVESRDRISEAYAKWIVPHPPELLLDALQDYFRGIDDREVWRVGMMIGYFEEDAGDR